MHDAKIVGAVMPDPATIAAGIQAGASVIGGLLGRNKATKPGDIVRATRAGILGQASGAREASELYGFNPMALLGVSQPIIPAAADNSMMGQGIANAGLAVAEGINEASAQKAYLQKLEEQNKELRKALDGQTLRPKVPGIFGQRVPQAGVAETVQAERLDSSGGPGGEVLQMDKFGFPLFVRGNMPDRPMEIKPEVNEPLHKVTRFLGHDLIVWNDEAVDSEVMATASAASIPFQYLWAETAKNSAERRKQRLAGTLETPALTIGYNKGDKRPPVEKRVDLRNWPHDGWDPFGAAYRGAP